MSYRFLVAMSAALIHHGHIRLLRAARQAADERNALVILGLAGDEEILHAQGYYPELSFAERKEILLACRYVDEVIEAPWLLTTEFLQQAQADFLFHDPDSRHPNDLEKLVTLVPPPPSPGVPISELRLRATSVIHSHINRRKVMLTPGPGSIPLENVFAVQPFFGRGDPDYNELEERVFYQLRRLTGLPCIVPLQGSASLALEIAAHSFLAGRVLVIDTGNNCENLIHYSQTLRGLQRVSLVDIVSVTDFLASEPSQWQMLPKYDWILSVYSEISTALLNDVPKLAALKGKLGAKLFLDASASIGLEEYHHLADLIAFSSCQGLAAMTGAAFICYQDDLIEQAEPSVHLNIRSHLEKKIAGPYHAMAALDRLLPMQDEVCARIRRSKEAFLAQFLEYTVLPPERQPLIATQIRGTLQAQDTEPEIVFCPESRTGHSVVCHLGELHLPSEEASQIPPLLKLTDIEKG